MFHVVTILNETQSFYNCTQFRILVIVIYFIVYGNLNGWPVQSQRQHFKYSTIILTVPY